MNLEKKICRFCQTVCVVFETIEESSKASINKLHLNIDLTKTPDPVMCKKCSDIIAKFSEFKSRPQTQSTQDRQLDLTEECVTNTSENRMNCLLCMNTGSCGYFIQLTAETKIAVNILLLKCFSEIVVDCSKEVEICPLCLKFLKEFSSFIKICLETEKKIKNISNKGPTKCLELTSLLGHKDLHNVTEINTQEMSSDSTIVVNTPKSSINLNATLELRDCTINIKRESSLYVPKKNVLSTRQSSSAKKQEVVVNMCEHCMHQTKSKHVQSIHSLQCKVCSIRHALSAKKHKLVNKCELCDYQTKFKHCLWQHMLTHKGAGKVPTHKSAKKSFATKYKNPLGNHKQLHTRTKLKSNLNKYESKYRMPLYECTECNVGTRPETKPKKRDRKAVNKCDLCEYQTKFEDSLIQHMLIHRGCSVHKCLKCDFDTIHKSCLQRHMLKHKSIRNKCRSRVVRNKCPLCEYQTKFKDSLRQHMIVHKRLHSARM